MRIDALPIWAVFAGTIVVVMVAIEAGYLLGQAMHRRSDEEKESPVSAIAGAILGLAAFMLAFTFGIV
jgi:putative Ca2+/H+ antiporter (TMEM165/GDT1 family)